jgi:hypothetical protein
MRRAVRLTLLLVFLAAMGLTARLFWTAEQEVRRTEAATRAFDEAARAAILSATELRAAQQAYVAAGQGIDFWFARTNALQNELKGEVSALRARTSASDAVAAFENALGVLQDFEQMDFRARERTRARQTSAASDLIFADGLDLTRKIAASIEQGRAAAIAASESETAAVERRKIFSLGAAAAAGTLIVLLLVPVREREVPRLVSAPSVPATSPLRPMLTEPVELDDGVTIKPAQVVRAEPPPPPPAPAPAVVEPPPAPVIVQVPVPEPPRIDLPGMARLVGDMARLVDTRALPGMLERAAELLDASGIVLWIADPDGRELAPIMTHGYPQQLVTRLGTIQRGAENATAAAFRTSLLQTVDADSVSSGAIAAPLVTPIGCVGVMAAEIRNDGERQDAVLAAAGIVAAQLATLVGPPSSRVKVDATG